MKQKFDFGKVLSISIAHMFADIYTAFFAPMLPLLIEKFGMSITMSGFLDVIRKSASMINPLVGIIADKVCLRYFVIFAPAVAGIFMSLLGVASSYLMVAILLFFTGIVVALFHVPAPVMVKRVSGEQMGKGMSFYMFGGEIARTLGPLLITAVISWWGMEKSYRAMPLGILASIFLFFKLKNVKVNAVKKNTNKQNIKQTLFKLKGFFIIIAGYTVFRSMIKLALTLYLPTYLVKQGHSLWLAGIALSVLQFSGAFGAFIAGPISDKIGRKTALLIAAIAMPIFMFLFLISNSFFMIPLLILLGFFTIATTPVILALVQEADTERPAFVNSIYMTISFGISSLMVLLIGILSDSFGMQKTYLFCTIAAVGAIPFILMLKPKKQN